MIDTRDGRYAMETLRPFDLVFTEGHLHHVEDAFPKIDTNTPALA